MRMQDRKTVMRKTSSVMRFGIIQLQAKLVTHYALRITLLLLLFTVHCSLSYAASDSSLSDSSLNEKGAPISMELRDVELSDVLRALGQEHGINIIIDEKVTGKVTVSLRNVPLWDAIDSILKGKGFAYIRDGNIVRVISSGADEDLATYTATVNYANAKDIEGIVTKVLSKRGSIASDPKSNMVVIRDIPSAIERVTQLLKQVDVKTKQIMIEAKIVEVSTNASRELGIQWGGSFYAQSWPNTLSGNFSVNVPTATTGTTATTTTTQGGVLGLTLGYANLISVNLQLSALEAQGNAKILSSPKVLVMDNQEAYIKSGTGILIPTTATTTAGATTPSVTEKEAVLQLKVTPRVINDDQISLKILTTRDSFDFSRSVLGTPPKNTRETQTNLIVKNGETIVIGGIYTETDSESGDGVPLLSKIPVLGWLFKKETKTKDKTELLIFITPRIKAE